MIHLHACLSFSAVDTKAPAAALRAASVLNAGATFAPITESRHDVAPTPSTETSSARRNRRWRPQVPDAEDVTEEDLSQWLETRPHTLHNYNTLIHMLVGAVHPDGTGGGGGGGGRARPYDHTGDGCLYFRGWRGLLLLFAHSLHSSRARH